MDRQQAMKLHREHSIANVLRDLMEIIEPGELLKWGTKTYEELVGYSAIHLAQEYQAISGFPVTELLGEDGQKQQVSGPPPPEEDALPLG
jgi:hypothetical protein